MSEPITFFVPGQPQGKGRPRIGKAGGFSRMFTPEKTAAYEGLIALAARQEMAGRELLIGPVSVRMSIDLTVPASWSQKKQRDALEARLLPTTKPDCDNTVKAVFDGLNGVAWKDDVQVVDLTVSKRYAKTPGVLVTIRVAT